MKESTSFSNLIREVFSSLEGITDSPAENCGAFCALLFACKNGGLFVADNNIGHSLDAGSEVGLMSSHLIEQLNLRPHSSFATLVNRINSLHSAISNASISYGEVVATILECASANRQLRSVVCPKELYDLCSSLVDNAPDKVLYPFDDLAQFECRNPIGLDVTILGADNIAQQFGRISLALIGAHGSNANFLPVSAPESWTANNYNAILSIPVLGATGIVPGDRTSSESLLLKHFDNLSADNGQLVTLVPAGALLRNKEKELRQSLTAQNLLDMVILLPNRLLGGTGIQTAIVVLKKQRQNDAPISLIDASQMCHKGRLQNILDLQKVVAAIKDDNDCKVLVSCNDVQRRDWSWNVSEYFSANSLSLPILDANSVPYKISDLLNRVAPNFNYTELNGRIVSVADLTSDAFCIDKDVNKLPVSQIQNRLAKLEESAFLVSRIAINGKLKMAFCNASAEAPVFYKPDTILAYTVLPSVDVFFFALQLQMAKLSFLFSGSSIFRLNRESFERFEICLPPIADQKLIYQAAREQYLSARAKEQGLVDVINHMKKVYINEVRLRKHEMAQYIQQISSIKIVMEHTLAQMASDDNVDKLRAKVQLLGNAVVNLGQKLDVLSQEEVFGAPEDIKLREFVNAFCQNYPKSKCFSTEVSFDSCFQDVFINIAKDDLQSLFQNVFENAERHGFVDSARTDYKIIVDVRIDKDFATICFSNNGNPLLNGLTTERFALRGEKAGEYANNGIGGAHIQRIVDHYKGSLDVGNADGYVEIKVQLPLSQNQEDVQEI